MAWSKTLKSKFDTTIEASTCTFTRLASDGTYLYAPAAKQGSYGKNGILAYQINSDGTLTYVTYQSMSEGIYYVECKDGFIFAGTKSALYAYTFNGVSFALAASVPYPDYVGVLKTWDIRAGDDFVFVARWYGGVYAFSWNKSDTLTYVAKYHVAGTFATEEAWWLQVESDSVIFMSSCVEDVAPFGGKNGVVALSFNGAAFSELDRWYDANLDREIYNFHYDNGRLYVYASYFGGAVLTSTIYILDWDGAAFTEVDHHDLEPDYTYDGYIGLDNLGNIIVTTYDSSTYVNGIRVYSYDGSFVLEYDEETPYRGYGIATVGSKVIAFARDRITDDCYFYIYDTALECSFTADPETGYYPLTVQFTDTSTGDISSWAWDFGDTKDNTSTEQHPSHQFRRPGTYTVTLTVQDVNGNTDSATKEIVVTFRLAGNLALEKHQGVGFSFDTGDSLVYPFDSFPPVLVYDDNDQPMLVCFDREDRKPYQINTRDGPPDLSITKYWKDKVATDGSGGTDPAPRFATFEARGSFEHYFLEAKRFHLYVRNVDDDDIDADGFDERGYPDGLLAQLDLYGDGDPSTEIVTAERIALPKHEITFDKKVSDVNRLWALFTFNKAKIRITGWDGDIVAKDQPGDPSGLVQSEGGYQQEVAEPVMWLGLHWGSLKNFVTGAAVSGTVTVVSDPSGRTDAIQFASALTLPSVTLAGGSLFLWAQSLSSLTIGGVEVTLTEYGTVGSWSLKYATGITKTGAVVLNPSGNGQVFDFRAFNSAITTNFLAWYKNDVENNSGNKVLKR